MNYFNENNEKNIYVLENVAIECKSTNELISVLKNETYKKLDPKIIQNFIEKKIFKFDGKCGERAAENITKLIKKEI